MSAAILNIVEKTKICSKCEQTKDLSEYGKHKLASDGLRTVCNSCRHIEYKAKRIADGKIYDERKTVQLIDGGRVCLSCNQEKQWDEFAKDIVGYNQKTATCKKCRNAKYVDPRKGDLKSRPDRLLRQYGITYEHVTSALDIQHGLCANRACGKEIFLNIPLGKNRAVIDHCHKSGEFRALLCPECNTTLGTMETKQNLMIGLQEYLTKFNYLKEKIK